MPEVECRLWGGACIDWAKERDRTVYAVRCQGPCQAVYPAADFDELGRKINLETMRCWECEAKGAENDD